MYEKNQQRLLSEKGFGYQMLKIPKALEQRTIIDKVEVIQWSEEQENDVNQQHVYRTGQQQSLIINERLYVFTNLNPEHKHSVKIVDFSMNQIFPIVSSKYAPSVSRINYSLSSWKHKVYLYGGLDSNNKILESMDEFDASLYKFTPVKYRLDFKPVGRQGHQAVVLDMYTMYIIGGTFSESLIDPLPIPADDMILNYDPDSATFQKVSIKTQGPSDTIPNNMVHHSMFRLDKVNLGIIWYDFEAKSEANPSNTTHRNMRLTIYNIGSHCWKDVSLVGQEILMYRLGMSILPLYNEKKVCDKVLILGGVDISEPVATKLAFATLDFKVAQDFMASQQSKQKKQKKLKLLTTSSTTTN